MASGHLAARLTHLCSYQSIWYNATSSPCCYGSWKAGGASQLDSCQPHEVLGLSFWLLISVYFHLFAGIWEVGQRIEDLSLPLSL